MVVVYDNINKKKFEVSKGLAAIYLFYNSSRFISNTYKVEKDEKGELQLVRTKARKRTKRKKR